MYRFVSGSLNFVVRGLATKFVVVVVVVVVAGTFFCGSTALVGQGVLVVEVLRSYSDTPHSEGLLLTSDRPVAETST